MFLDIMARLGTVTFLELTPDQPLFRSTDYPESCLLAPQVNAGCKIQKSCLS